MQRNVALDEFAENKYTFIEIKADCLLCLVPTERTLGQSSILCFWLPLRFVFVIRRCYTK